MDVDKGSWQILHKAIDEWEATEKLSKGQADGLRSSLDYKHSERKQIAQYFFLIALFCTMLAFGALFLNEKLLEKIKLYFSWDNLAIAGITAVLSVVWFWYTRKTRKRLSPNVYELFMAGGGLSVLTSLIYFCKQAGQTDTYTVFLLLSCCCLWVLSILFRSKILWIGGLAAVIGWFGEFSIDHGSNNLFLGMNYPMRYTVLGLAILLLGVVQGLVDPLAFSKRITYSVGLVLFFSGMWGISIFGNYNTLTGWQQVRQIHVLAYSIVFGAASVAGLFLGVRYKDDMARDISVLFLLINLYTRYFEYFWDSMNKGIFFLVLAITFGFIGWWLERKRRKPLTPSQTEPIRQ